MKHRKWDSDAKQALRFRAPRKKEQYSDYEDQTGDDIVSRGL